MPPGYLGFEIQHRAEMAPATPVTVPYRTWIDLADQVNDAVNARINFCDPLGSDDCAGQQDRVRRSWIEIETSAYGDCKDYAVTKRHDLLAAGFPAGATRLIWVSDRDPRATHIVLEIATDRGIYVLDNQHAYIYPQDEMTYEFISLQAWGNPAQWTLSAN